MTSVTTDAGILAGYVEQGRFAKEINSSTRTVARYRNLPNGLPWLMLSGRVYIPVAEAKTWLADRVHRPNSRRK
jgi:hypothetical protein